MWRAAAAGVSVVFAAVSGVVTALVTTHPTRGLWVALGVVVVIGAALQVVVTYNENRASKIEKGTIASGKSRRIEASGTGAVAIGGSAHHEIQTRVHGGLASALTPTMRDGVSASGSGAVAIGGDSVGSVSTHVSGSEPKEADG